MYELLQKPPYKFDQALRTSKFHEKLMKYDVDHVDIDEISRFPAQKSEDFIQNSSKKVVENGSFRENCELWTVGSLRNRREILQVNRGICRSRRDLAVPLAES